MKGSIKWIILILVVLIAGVYLRTLFSDLGTTSYDQVQYTNQVFKEADGTPFSGTLLIKPKNLNDLFSQTSDLLPDLGKNAGWNQIHYLIDAEKQFQGLVFHLALEEGKLNGISKCYLDLREAKGSILDRELNMNFKYYMAKTFHPRIKVSEVPFEHNEINGIAKVWLPDEENGHVYLKAEAPFSRNQIDGEIRMYRPNGNLHRTYTFRDGIPTNTDKKYYESGKLYIESQQTEESLITQKYHYENGQLSRLITRDQSSGNYSYKEWYPDGSDKLQDERINDSTRIYKKWHSNGKLAEEGIGYEKRVFEPEGTIHTYHYNGELKTEYTYNASGQRDGPYTIYYITGQKWEEGNYKNDLRDGQLKKWYTNGQLAEDHLVRNGKIEGNYQRWYYNGLIWKQGTFAKGIAEGLYEKWFNNGQQAYVYTYKNGKLEGEYKKWYPDGTLRLHCFYKDGKLHGSYDNWNEDGTLYTSTRYENGKELK